MLDSVRPLALQLTASDRHFREAMRDFLPDAWEGRLGSEPTNHAAYVALHLLDARCFLLRSLGVDVYHGFEALTRNARRLEDIETYPGPDEVLDAWKAAGEELITTLEALDEERLAGASPHPAAKGEAVRLSPAGAKPRAGWAARRSRVVHPPACCR